MTPPPSEVARLAGRGIEVLRDEGLQGLALRGHRRLLGTQDRVFGDYRAWLEDAAPPVGPAPPAPGPRVSVVVPVCDPPPAVLDGLWGAVRAQTYGAWELCLADDASRRPEVVARLDAAARDPRVRLVRLPARRGIAGATNAALARATGELVAFADHDDLLAPEALAEVVRAFRDDPEVDLAYSDEDKVDLRGRRSTPWLKPAWDPTLHLGCNYVAHLLAVRRDLLERTGPLRSAYDGSQDYDLILRLVEGARRVAHVPRVLYHWRTVPGSVAARPGAKPAAYAAARRALRDALARRGEPARVEPLGWLGGHRVRYADGPDPADVTAVVSAPRAPRWLADLGLGEVLAGGPRAARARAARRPWVLLLGRVRPRGDPARALGALLEQGPRRGVGFVTGRLLRGRRIAEQGLALGWGEGGAPGCPEAGLSAWDLGYFGLASLPRSVAAAGGDLLLVRRATLEALGGLDPALDPDPDAQAAALCRRGAAVGLRTVATPEACFHRLPGSLRGRGPHLWVVGAERDDPYVHPGFAVGRRPLRLRPRPEPWSPRSAPAV